MTRGERQVAKQVGTDLVRRVALSHLRLPIKSFQAMRPISVVTFLRRTAKRVAKNLAARARPQRVALDAIDRYESCGPDPLQKELKLVIRYCID